MWKIWLFWSWQCHPAKEFTPQGTACYLFGMAVKKAVGWERNGEKCSAGRIHSYLWARKRSCKSSNLNKISHLTCVSTSCLILAFLCSLTHNSSCCPLILLQLPITPTHTPLCQLVSWLPHSVTCPFPLNVPQWLCLVHSLSYSFLYGTCPAHHLLLNLCPKLLLLFATSDLSPWIQPALPCLLPILCLAFPPQALQFSWVISYFPLLVYIAVRWFLHFSFLLLLGCQQKEQFTQFPECCCFQPGTCCPRYIDALHHQQKWQSIHTQWCAILH